MTVELRGFGGLGKACYPALVGQAAEDAAEGVDVERAAAVLTLRDGRQAQSVVTKQGVRKKVARIFHQHRVARVGESAHGQREATRIAGSGEERVRWDVVAVLLT